MKTNQLIQSDPLPDGYGIFPYLIIRISGCLYLQVPITLCNQTFCNKVLAKEVELPSGVFVGIDTYEEKMKRTELTTSADIQEKLIYFLRQYVNDKSFQYKNGNISLKLKDTRTCLVLDKDKCIYYENAELIESDALPSGGLLIDNRYQWLRQGGLHYLEDQPEFIDLSGSEVL
jgi:hypothetical protein